MEQVDHYQVAQPLFIPKKGMSIFPRKRKLVKKIVLDSILKAAIPIPIFHRPAGEEMELSKEGTEEMVEAEFGRPRFMPKKGSIFPRKRRSVMKMVLHSIATHLCCLNHHPKNPPEDYAKNVKIFPHQAR